MIYFTSDTHFDHANIIKSCNRPFKNVDEMNIKLIENWNSVIKSNSDEVIILGDFIWNHNEEHIKFYTNVLRGKKYLIKGNHDIHKKLNGYFEWIKDYFSLKWEKKQFILSHFPFMEWDNYYHGSYHLFGHIHNGSKSPEQKYMLEFFKNKRAYNVGVDVNDFKPISIIDIVAKLP